MRKKSWQWFSKMPVFIQSTRWHPQMTQQPKDIHLALQLGVKKPQSINKYYQILTIKMLESGYLPFLNNKNNLNLINQLSK